MMWEQFERIGLLIMIAGFSLLGWFGWNIATQNSQVLGRLSSVETRLKDLSGGVPPPPAAATQPTACDRNCVRSLVSEAVATISGMTGSAKQQVIERVVEKVQPPIQQTAGGGSKTQYIPLGAGETTSTEWVIVPGAEITFNITDFGTVKKAYFEAQLQSSAGLVKARLWDKTAGTIVSGSEISHVAGDASLVSVPVVIPSGGRTIVVQLESEVQQPVRLLSSRLRIDVQ